MKTDINGRTLPAIYSKIPKNYGEVLDKEKQALIEENRQFNKKAKTRMNLFLCAVTLGIAALTALVCYLLKISPIWKWAVIFALIAVPSVLLAYKLKRTTLDKAAAELAEKASYYRRRKDAYRNNSHAYEILEQATIVNFTYGGEHASITYKIAENEKPKVINLEYVPYEGSDDDFPEEFIIFYKDHIEARGGSEEELKFSTTFMG